MSRSVLFFFICSFLPACRQVPQTLSVSDEQTMEYQIGKNEYAVVIPFEQGMTEAEAKQAALKKAAQKAQREQFRYFTVEKEGEVGMITSGKGSDSSQQRNMYYDLFQSDNVGRERYSDEQRAQGNSQTGYRIVFKCYAEKPNEKAIDVCTVVPCH